MWFLFACSGPDSHETGDPLDSATPTTTESSLALKSLTVDGATLSPAFAPGLLHYVVDGPVTQVFAEPVDPDATVTLKHSDVDWNSLDSGISPFEVDLQVGQRIDVVVDNDTGSATTTILLPPDDLPEFTLIERDDAASAHVYLLANFPVGGPGNDYSPYLTIISNTATPIWYRALDAPALDFRVNRNGVISWVGPVDGGPAGQILDPDTFGLASTYTNADLDTGASVTVDHRELMVRDDGSIITLGQSVRSEDLSEYSTLNNCCNVSDFIAREVAPDGTILFEWNSKDAFDYGLDLPQDVLDRINQRWDYAHVNSVDVDPEDGNWIISAKYMSSVIKVARNQTVFKGETFEAGEVIWRLGGLRSDFTFTNDERNNGWVGFADQHNAKVSGPNTLLIYDNSTWPGIGTTGDSRYVEYTVETNAMTATVIDSYDIKDSGSTGICGSAQRLANGNTVIGWGSLNSSFPGAPAVTEIDPDGKVLFSASLPDPELSYRAYAAIWDGTMFRLDRPYR